ncbi:MULTISPECIES: hypothetical protein [Streptomyces]|uniref:hypothetical protein n=1 Tax=Streptomyces TaxID=1883 RepID=UPI001D15D2E9|nr:MULTISPECIES: hypothetical protein [Streptomyces]MCC3650951.1 hypothetical protein [Streptomyces sp. S07_1.15]WSQ74208.1 hypothetical protein OG463_24190 [Streptomyces xinghaiensis]
MNSLLETAALLVTAAGLLSALATLAGTRRPRLALRVLLDFLTGAGLLRLSHDPTWDGILLVAALVAVRKIAVFGMLPSALPPPAGRERGARSGPVGPNRSAR